MNPPTGVFASAGALNSEVMADMNVRGVLIRAKWSEIESTEGEFDFTWLDRQIAIVKAYDKDYSLGILAGPFSPKWLVNQVGIATIASPRGSIPVWWDFHVTEALFSLAKALAAKYASDPSLSLVYIPQMTGNGIEGHFNGVSSAVLTDAGYTSDDFATSAEATAYDFGTTFPNTPLALEYHSILDSNEHVEQTIELLDGKGVGAAIWWLNGATNYQADLLDIIRNYAGDKYAQVLDKSSNTKSFPNGYAAVFDQAKDLGIRYIEPWDYEFTIAGNLWGPTFDDFNTWADQR